MHEPEATAICFSWPNREVDSLVEEAQFTGVGDDDTREDLDQRAFTRTVLTEQPVDFARSDLQLSAGEGQRAAVPLGDATGVEQWCLETVTDSSSGWGGHGG